MSLIQIVKDNFPGLETEEKLNNYMATAKKNIDRQTAICALFGNMVVGFILFSTKRNMLCHMAVHPEFRRMHIATRMFELMLEKMDKTHPVVVETFREEDEKGAAPRAFYIKMGFQEGEFTSFDGYPTQKFYLYLDK
jgi:ribosomal protein S18 acetylase RimI-like enzyme